MFLKSEFKLSIAAIFNILFFLKASFLFLNLNLFKINFEIPRFEFK